MAYNAQKIVLDPDGFFEDASQGPRLWIPAVFVFLIGAVGVARGMYTSSYVSSAMETGGAGAAGGAGFTRYLFMLPSLVTPFVSWLVVGVVLVVVSMYLGGDGDLSDTVAVAGWGFLPALVGAVLTLGLTVHMLSGTDPSGIQEAAETQGAVFETLRSTEMRVIRYVLVGWQAFIWTFGVRHVQGLELRNSAIPAVTAACLVVAWDLFGDALLFRLMGVFF